MYFITSEILFDRSSVIVSLDNFNGLFIWMFQENGVVKRVDDPEEVRGRSRRTDIVPRTRRKSTSPGGWWLSRHRQDFGQC